MTWPGCLKMSFLCINTSDDHKLKCPEESILSISNDQKMKYFIDLKEVVRTEMINPKLMSFPFTTWAKTLEFLQSVGKTWVETTQNRRWLFYDPFVVKPGPGTLGRDEMAHANTKVYDEKQHLSRYWKLLCLSDSSENANKRGKGIILMFSWGTIVHEWDFKYVKNLQWTPCTKNNFSQAADLVILRSFALPSWRTRILQSWR